MALNPNEEEWVDQQGFVWVGNEVVNHRTYFKVVVNTILRALQPWSHKPLLLATKCKWSKFRGQPQVKFVGYTFERVEIVNDETPMVR